MFWRFRVWVFGFRISASRLSGFRVSGLRGLGFLGFGFLVCRMKTHFCGRVGLQAYPPQGTHLQLSGLHGFKCFLTQVRREYMHD